MGIFDLWREARGAVLRKEYDDLIVRMQGNNHAARSAFLNNVHQTVDEITAYYSAASKAERKKFLSEIRKEQLQMWNGGDWPSALGVGVSCLNAQSRLTPGEDAAYVRRETDRLIEEAQKNFSKSN